jgi:hypothetical protein
MSWSNQISVLTIEVLNLKKSTETSSCAAAGQGGPGLFGRDKKSQPAKTVTFANDQKTV